jgi:DNA-binding response OmpR family regulator
VRGLNGIGHLARVLAERGFGVTDLSSAHEARAALARERTDVVVVHRELSDAEGPAFCREIGEQGWADSIVLAAEHPSLADAQTAMRAGASDLLDVHAQGAALVERVMEAIERASRARRTRRTGEKRAERLRGLCRKLYTSRTELTKQVGSLCTDLASAYHELSEQLVRVSMASDFSGVIRQELDLEGLLRTVLEFVLAKVGPTNAAIFLPASSGDYTLGAYVNYDCAKDTAEVMLDHLAGCLAPKFENTRGVQVFPTSEQVKGLLGENSEWVGDSCLLAAPCRGGEPGEKTDECLAVLVLFRDRRAGFTPDMTTRLGIICDLFAGQLSRVIRIHHRHLPKHKWGAPGAAIDDESDDAGDIDLAA